MNLLLWIGCLAWLQDRGVERQTAHYRLHVEKLNAEEVGRMLEESYRQHQAHFKKTPRGLLRLEIYADRERWAAAIRACGKYQKLSDTF